MESIGLPTAFFLSARFISLNSTEAGFSIFAAIVVFAFFSTVSDLSASRPGGGASGVELIAELGTLFDEADAVSQSADAGSRAFADVVTFTFSVAGPGLSDTALIQPADWPRFCEYNLSTCSAPAMARWSPAAADQGCQKSSNDKQSHAFPPPQAIRLVFLGKRVEKLILKNRTPLRRSYG